VQRAGHYTGRAAGRQAPRPGPLHCALQAAQVILAQVCTRRRFGEARGAL